MLTLYLVDDVKGVSISNGRVSVTLNGEPLFYQCSHERAANCLTVRSVQPSYKRHKDNMQTAPERVNSCVLPVLSCTVPLLYDQTCEDQLLVRLATDIATLKGNLQDEKEFLPTL